MAEFDSPELLKALEAIENRDYSLAFELLAPLAGAGNPKAQCNLANLYHFGWGVSVDGEKAIDLYQRVAAGNITDGHLSGLALHSLATICRTGLPGIQPDHQKAQQYSKQARELGFEM